jgi:hypothetical protein
MQQVEQLKALCKELESQAQDLEKIVEHRDLQLQRISEEYVVLL